jgi:hypothetical protein
MDCASTNSSIQKTSFSGTPFIMFDLSSRRNKTKNRRVDLNREQVISADIFLKYPARSLPKFIDITYKTKIQNMHHCIVDIIENVGDTLILI